MSFGNLCLGAPYFEGRKFECYIRRIETEGIQCIEYTCTCVLATSVSSHAHRAAKGLPNASQPDRSGQKTWPDLSGQTMPPRCAYSTVCDLIVHVHVQIKLTSCSEY